MEICLKKQKDTSFKKVLEEETDYTLFKKGHLVYINKNINGVRRRFSTKLKWNDKNIEYVVKNIKNFINSFIEKEKAKEGHRDSSALFSVIEKYLATKEFLKPNTKLSYKNACARLIYFCQKEKINDVKLIDKVFVTKYIHFLLSKTKNRTTLQTYLINFSNFLKFCYENDFITKNPYKPIKFSGIELKESEVEPFNLDEVKLILNTCEDRNLKTYLQVAFFTGLRTGEILGLKWEDVNFEKKEISIQRTLVLKNKKKQTHSPKTKSSKRIIDMLKPVSEALKAYKDEKSEGFVFKDSYLHIQSSFYTLLEQLNFKKRHLYNTRHSFASIMLSKGEEHIWVGCKMLGHKNLNITYQAYAKYITEKDKERATFLNNLDLDEQKQDFFLKKEE